MVFKPGDHIENGKYIIKHLLGKGGMGAVYLAYQTSVERDVAIKVLFPHLTYNDSIKQRFRREAKLMAKLNHPHCITVYDFGETNDGILYIVMERLQGHTLAEELIQKGALSLSESLSVIKQSCLALQRAHALSLVHRDLKPENIYITPITIEAGDTQPESEFHVTILDFGIAKVLAKITDHTNHENLDQIDTLLPSTNSLVTTHDGSMSAQEIRRKQRSIYTHENAIIGTPLYMSPEHSDQTQIDHRADIYALGLILYECLMGEPVFKRNSIADLLIAHAHTPPPKLNDYRPDLPQSLSDLIDCCLAKRKEERISEVSFILECIEALENEVALPLQTLETLAQIKSLLGSQAHDVKAQSKSSASRHSVVSENKKNTPNSTIESNIHSKRTTFMVVVISICLSMAYYFHQNQQAWKQLYTSIGQAKTTPSGSVTWLFDNTLNGQDSQFYSSTQSHSKQTSTILPDINGSSYDIIKQWQIALQPAHEFRTKLKGVRFESYLNEGRKTLDLNYTVNLPAEFTIEFWVYPRLNERHVEHKKLLLGTLGKKRQYDVLTLYDYKRMWSTGWGIVADPQLDHLLIEFAYLSSDDKTNRKLQASSLLQVAFNPTKIAYHHWNHIVLISTPKKVVWITNGIVHAIEKSLPLIQSLYSLYLGSSPQGSDSPLNMNIDDVRITNYAIPIESIQKAYQLRRHDQSSVSFPSYEAPLPRLVH